MAKYTIWGYITLVKKKHAEEALIEFKFHYRNSDSIGLSDKYFMAHDLDEAIGMFDYVCDKRHLSTPKLLKYSSGIGGCPNGKNTILRTTVRSRMIWNYISNSNHPRIG